MNSSSKFCYNETHVCDDDWLLTRLPGFDSQLKKERNFGIPTNFHTVSVIHLCKCERDAVPGNQSARALIGSHFQCRAKANIALRVISLAFRSVPWSCSNYAHGQLLHIKWKSFLALCSLACWKVGKFLKIIFKILKLINIIPRILVVYYIKRHN